MKRAGQLTARDLATKLSLSLNAVRHHLKELEAEGVVGYRREQRGVGAPTFAYHLTAEGEGLFPQRQAELLTDVLDRLAAQSGRGAIVSAMETRFADLAHKLQAELAGASPSRRREVVRQALTDGGFMAGMDRRTRRIQAHRTSLRHSRGGRAISEICEAEAKFLHEVLAAAVEREAHILQGCTACEYKVRFPETGELTDLTWNRESNEESA